MAQMNKLDFRPLPRSFYTRRTLTVAKELLGKYLIRVIGRHVVAGKIVEVEAYGGEDDPGSHAYRGMTPRNRVMFEEGGHAYVYFTYGKHYCFNVVTERRGVPGAVLVRALEPIYGIEIMQRNRGVKEILNLTNGPGKLTQAMRITKEHNGLDLTEGREIFISQPETPERFEVVSTTRIGLRQGADKPWRFYIKGNKFVSKK